MICRKPLDETPMLPLSKFTLIHEIGGGRSSQLPDGRLDWLSVGCK